jgi:hypothetical protein
MQKFYSAPHIGTSSAILKNFLVTVIALLFLNLTEIKAQAGNNLSYDGVDDYITLGPNVVQGIGVGYTFEAWVYWKGNAGSGTTWQRIFDIGSSTSNWVALTVDNGTGNPLFGTNISGSQITFQATAALPQNVWAHIAVTVDATGVATIYINGVAQGTGGGFTNPLSLMGPTTNNWLGRSQYSPPAVAAPGDPYFFGQIDEFRISNIVRYTTNFAPVPKTEFTPDGNTVALYHFNEGGTAQTTVDASANGFNAVLGATTAVESVDPTWVGGSILPIKLASISAIVNNNAVDVKWSASLDRESEFVIERSNNGANFSAIGTVSKTSGTNGFENFSFRDNAPLNGRSYYRLKCTETGSAPFYSKTIPVAISAKEDLLVYPNPVNKNFITVELPKAYTGNIEFTISSTSGVAVFKQKMNVVDTREFQLPKNSSFLPGTYILEINSGGIKRSKVIIYQ